MIYKSRCGKEFGAVAKIGGHSATCLKCKELKQIELKNKNKHCLVCGNELTNLQQKYCSQNCTATAGGLAMNGYKYSDKKRKNLYSNRMNYRKGKSLEEIFGIDKANNIRQKSREANLGKTISKEIREKISKTEKGREITWGDKISNANKGRDVKPEWERKRLESRLGMLYEDYLKLKPEFDKYKSKVWSITKKQPLHLLENIDKRALAGTKGGFQLDHIISIKDGFNKKISVDLIGHISNLRVITWEENLKKGAKSLKTSVCYNR